MNSITAKEVSLSAPTMAGSSVVEETQDRFRFGRVLRLSSFHIGSAMVDILVASVWNRVMISDFHISPSAIGFLLALRYFLSPLGIWAGFRSDTRPFGGLW